MKIVQSILTKNPCYTAGRKITVRGLMLHSVGCSQPNAEVFVRNWNSASFDRACVHGFIDGNTGVIYQTLPWNHRGWHGGGASNNTHIGVEMCEPACIRYTGGSTFTCSDQATARAVATRTYNAAVELFAMLCKEYDLNPLGDGVIVSHKEGHSRGIASNHGDPEHLWRGLGMSFTMDGFRKAVKAAMGGATAPVEPVKPVDDSKPAETIHAGDQVKITGSKYYNGKAIPGWVKNKKWIVHEVTGDRVVINKSTDGKCSIMSPVNAADLRVVKAVNEDANKSTASYLVRVSIPDLNIRKGPGISYDATCKYTGKGCFTIVEERDGWGRLKSGAGWICLDYTTRI